MIITFGSIKGGVGKTSLVTNITYMRAVIGNKKVLLVDADDHQWTASDWAEQRELQNIETPWTTIRLSGLSVKTQIKNLVNQYDDIFIDTGGRDSQSLRAALTISDFLISPFQPKSYDVWTLSKLKNLVDEMNVANENLKTYAVINRGDILGSDNNDAKEIISEIIECLPVTICQRKAFSNSASKGLSVFEMKKNVDKKAIQEITDLYNIIYTQK